LCIIVLSAWNIKVYWVEPTIVAQKLAQVRDEVDTTECTGTGDEENRALLSIGESGGDVKRGPELRLRHSVRSISRLFLRVDCVWGSRIIIIV